MMKLLNCYLPVFKLAATFIERPEVGAEYEEFRHQCITCLEQAVQAAEHLDISDYERDEAFFAVVVWLDETILCSALPHLQQWNTTLLQHKYFRTTVGGEEFFERLSRLNDECKQARLVFLFCLQRGFHGKYSNRSEYSTYVQLVGQQRQLCLPDVWWAWPNDAEITPVAIKKNALSPSLTGRYGMVFLGVLLFYGLLFVLQAFYFL